MAQLQKQNVMKKKNAYNVAVVGATGAVGTEMLQVLEERKFPVSNLIPLASFRSAGGDVSFQDHDYKVKLLRLYLDRLALANVLAKGMFEKCLVKRLDSMSVRGLL